MIYRPLIFFLIEITLAAIVFRKGKFLPKRIALFILFLSFYQLGETIILFSDFDKFGASFAYFSATLLPAIGVYIIEGATKKNIGSFVFFPTYFLLAIVFLINPDIIRYVGEEFCFLKVLGHPENSSEFLDIWKAAYPAGLSYGVFACVYFYFTEKSKQVKKDVFVVFLSYMLFFPTSLLIIYVFNVEGGYTASVMCAAAFLAAIISGWYSLSRRD